MVCDVDCRDCTSDNAFGATIDGGAMSMSYMLTLECEASRHDKCPNGIVCDCDCHDQAELEQREQMVCKCRDCGSEFVSPYFEAESYICDACLSKPREKPKGVFE